MLERVKKEIDTIYKTKPYVYVNVLRKPYRCDLQNALVAIKAVYPHIFIIEETGKNSTRHYAIQYNDIVAKMIEIKESFGPIRNI